MTWNFTTKFGGIWIFQHYEVQLLEGLVESLGSSLRLEAVTCEALVRCEAVTLSGFGLLFDVSLSRRHGVTPSSRVGLLPVAVFPNACATCSARL
jgi:hypothetical protein